MSQNTFTNSRHILRFRFTQRRSKDSTNGLPICTLYVDDDKAGLQQALGGHDKDILMCSVMLLWLSAEYKKKFKRMPETLSMQALTLLLQEDMALSLTHLTSEGDVELYLLE